MSIKYSFISVMRADTYMYKGRIWLFITPALMAEWYTATDSTYKLPWFGAFRRVNSCFLHRWEQGSHDLTYIWQKK